MFAEQIKQWKQACIGANTNSDELNKSQKAQGRTNNKRIKHLEVDLRRKERTLSETAALLVLHSDNGSPMKGSSLMAMLDNLGIASSPRVSNDNAFAE